MTNASFSGQSLLGKQTPTLQISQNQMLPSECKHTSTTQKQTNHAGIHPTPFQQDANATVCHRCKDATQSTTVVDWFGTRSNCCDFTTPVTSRCSLQPQSDSGCDFATTVDLGMRFCSSGDLGMRFCNPSQPRDAILQHRQPGDAILQLQSAAGCDFAAQATWGCDFASLLCGPTHPLLCYMRKSRKICHVAEFSKIRAVIVPGEASKKQDFSIGHYECSPGCLRDISARFFCKFPLFNS